jgi:hypothetical protein
MTKWWPRPGEMQADSATDASVGRVYVAAQELLDEIIVD